MADDQVKYSDLIVDDGAIDALDKRLDDIKKKMAEVKGEAATLTAETRNLSTATREQQQATSQNAAAAENLRQRMKGLTEEQKRLEAERRKYAKLTEEEANRVKTMSGVYQQYAQAVRNGTDAQMSELKALDLQNKSYNELYQTYNALKDALNQMTVAERQNTAAGQAMTNQAKEIRDTLNNLQQATGNYALNVGNYMSAFNGLQMQTQQIIREIPSALNLQQFFLAISNNIPMFADALARYNKELPGIKVKLASVTAEIAKIEAEMVGLNAETTEYAAKQAQVNALKQQEISLQKASVSGWKSVMKSVTSWQTLLIAALMLLRTYGSKVIDWIKGLGQGVKDLTERLDIAGKKFLGIIKAQGGISNTVAELQLVYDKLKNIDQGTSEWVDGVATVNRLTGENLNALDTTIDKVGDVVEKYKEMQEAMAINRIVSEKLGDAEVRSNIYRHLFYDPTQSGDNLRARRYNKDYINKLLKGFVTDDQMEQINDLLDDAHAQLAATREDARKTLDELYFKYILITGEEQEMWRNMYKIVNDGSGDYKKPKKEKEPSEQNTNEKYWEAEEQLLKAQYEGYQLERQLAKLNRDKARDEQNEWYVDQRLALDENLKNGFITQERYDQALVELNRQNKAIREGIDRKYWADLRALRSKNLKERKDEWKANANEVEKTAKDGAKAELKAEVDGWAQYKAKMVEEGKTRKQIVEAEVAAEIARLNLMLKLDRDVNGEIMSDEQKAKVQEWINLLEKLQQKGNYGDYKPGQFMGKGGANVTNERKRYTNIWEVLGIDMDNNQVSDLNSVFNQAKEALNSWMDAKVEAANRSKELADDEVAAAENALNREIELRNQGYANDVALKERELADAKKRQEKAVKMQQKAKKEQLAVNTAMEASSMAVAIANLFKDFSLFAAIPLTAVLLGAFAAAKIQAFKSINSTQYGNGGYMLLEGGSHQSGHDINLGIGPDGSNLRAEGGEYFAVINKRNSRRYGSEIPNIVNALNSGMFEDRYIKTSDAMGLVGQMGVVGNVGERVDLSGVESGVGALVKQGERTWSTEGEYRVMRYKNLTRRVRVG